MAKKANGSTKSIVETEKGIITPKEEVSVPRKKRKYTKRVTVPKETVLESKDNKEVPINKAKDNTKIETISTKEKTVDTTSIIKKASGSTKKKRTATSKSKKDYLEATKNDGSIKSQISLNLDLENEPKVVVPKTVDANNEKITKATGSTKQAIFENSDKLINVEKTVNTTKADRKSPLEKEEIVNNTFVKETITIDRKKIAKEEKQKQRDESALLKKKKKDAQKNKKRRKKRGPKVIKRYKTDVNNGLTQNLVNQRILEDLSNTSVRGSTKSIGRIVFSNSITFFNILCFAIAGWLISVQSYKDIIFIFMVILNTVIGIIQEIRAKKTIDKLSLVSAPSAVVLRNGTTTEIDVDKVVLDDIILLEIGKQICADSVVVEGVIEVNESLLTGESDAIIKKPGDTLFSGSFVVSGKCKAQVEHVGRDNYIEKLTESAKKYVKPKSDLWASLSLIIRVMTLVIIPIGAILFYMQLTSQTIVGDIFQSDAYRSTVQGTAGAMIGMIPSGLWLTTSIALQIGVIKLAKNNVLVQELFCIEMLSRVDCLCLDKTGTITDGTMSVKNYIDYNVPDEISTKDVISAYINAVNDKNMTNTALETKFGHARREKFTDTIPFSSSRKYSAVTFEKYGTYLLGAPEFILKDRYKIIEKDVNKYANMGYRILLLAHTDESIIDQKLTDYSKIKPFSIILIEDNVRPDAVETIAYFKESGVEVKVISGDNPLTVSKIAERAGITNASKYLSLDGISDNEVRLAAKRYTVFGRVSPKQKQILVKELKRQGHTVAMTGDGVNDILALKEADCSIAVASGSEAARNVSHLVLLDSNFGSMPKVVAEGRRVINNIGKVARLYLTKTFFSFFLSIQAINSGGLYPIRTSQLILADFFAIGAPSFFLVLESNNTRVTGSFLKKVIREALPGALTVLIFAMLIFALKDIMNMNYRIESTLIVITVTYTMMMVLFEVCQPFNFLRRILFISCFVSFVTGTIFFCRYLGFNPMFDFVGYTDTEEVITTTDSITATVSEEGHFVIDGTYYNEKGTIDDVKAVRRADDGMLVLGDGNITGYKFPIPSVIGVNASGFYVLDGNKTKITSELDDISQIVLTIDTEGYVYINGEKSSTNLLPTVEVSSGYLKINGEKTEIRFNSTIKSIGVDENWKIKVNNTTYDFTIDKPEISISEDGNIILGGIVANVTYTQVNNDLSPVVTINDVLNFTFDSDITDDIPAVISTTACNSPTIALSEGNMIIITVSDLDGNVLINKKITDKEFRGSTNQRNIIVREDGSLIVNGLDTDLKVSVTVEPKTSSVQLLPFNSGMLLIVMCLCSLPLMKLLRNIFPWMKKQWKNSTDYLNRM